MPSPAGGEGAATSAALKGASQVANKREEVPMTKAAVRLAAMLAALCAALSSTQAQSLGVEVLSSRPELVSGGSALVRITGAGGVPAVTADGKDVSSAFKAGAQGRWVGLVEG